VYDYVILSFCNSLPHILNQDIQISKSEFEHWTSITREKDSTATVPVCVACPVTPLATCSFFFFNSADVVFHLCDNTGAVGYGDFVSHSRTIKV
jgi:hypothetical protein